MILILDENHKKNLQFLVTQPVDVLQEFCKFVIEYLYKGPDSKQNAYHAAAQKIGTAPEIIRGAIEGLAYLFIECSRSKLSDSDFEETVVALGFTESLQQVLSLFFKRKRDEFHNLLGDSVLKIPHYKNLDWRFDVHVASRALHEQIVPIVTLNFSLNSEGNDVKSVILQTDPTNLVHMTQVLEAAMQESKSQHSRRIQHCFKQ